MNRDQIHAVFQDVFPLKSKDEALSLEFVSVTERADKPGDYWVIVRLVVWDVDGEKQSIRDVKEQEVYIDMPIEVTLDRLRAYLEGMKLAIVDLKFAVAETLMPHDLVIFKPLALKRAQTAADFEKALRGKSRLGKYLLPS